MKRNLGIVFICAVMMACAGQRKMTGVQPGINLLDIYTIPFSYSFQQTTVGGLSAIDYDRMSDTYYLLSDDRSEGQPARFYKASIRIVGSNIQAFNLLSVDSLRKANGELYPSVRVDPQHSIDPESLRYWPLKDQLIFTNEGERLSTHDTVLVQQPMIYLSRVTGKIYDSLPLPGLFAIQTLPKGARRNGTLEAISLNRWQNSLYACMEEPLYEDGLRAGLNDSSAWVRMIKYDLEKKLPLAQYAYQVEPVVIAPQPEDAFRVNGVTEILYVGSKQILVVERSWSMGQVGSSVKIFLADLSKATDITLLNTLINTEFVPVSKKLLLDMDTLGLRIDNVEGICFGPILPNGNPSILLVTDNNFSESQSTQLILLELRNLHSTVLSGD